MVKSCNAYQHSITLCLSYYIIPILFAKLLSLPHFNRFNLTLLLV